MTGTLAPDSFAGLREVLLAVGTRDASRLVHAFQRLNVLLPGADLDLLERACKKVFDTLWGKSTREMMRMTNTEFRIFADEFGDLLYQMPFQVPESLILLGRCVSILSGMASGLDPDFSVWNGLAPYVEKLMRKDGQTGARFVLKEIEAMARLLLALPRRAGGAGDAAGAGQARGAHAGDEAARRAPGARGAQARRLHHLRRPAWLRAPSFSSGGTWISRSAWPPRR